MQIKNRFSIRAVIALFLFASLLAFANVDSLARSKKSAKATTSSTKKSKSGKSSKSSSKKGGKSSKKGKSKGKTARHYNPTQTRAQAMETLRGSDDLAALAGIESTD